MGFMQGELKFQVWVDKMRKFLTKIGCLLLLYLVFYTRKLHKGNDIRTEESYCFKQTALHENDT